MPFDVPREVVASAQRTTSGGSGPILLRGPGDQLHLAVAVTAVGADANETLDLDVEWSMDGGNTWAAGDPADDFTQLTQPGGSQTVIKAFDVKAPIYRIVWTVGGTTPEFTFSVREYVT